MRISLGLGPHIRCFGSLQPTTAGSIFSALPFLPFTVFSLGEEASIEICMWLELLWIQPLLLHVPFSKAPPSLPRGVQDSSPSRPCLTQMITHRDAQTWKLTSYDSSGFSSSLSIWWRPGLLQVLLGLHS